MKKHSFIITTDRSSSDIALEILTEILYRLYFENVVEVDHGHSDHAA